MVYAAAFAGDRLRSADQPTRVNLCLYVMDVLAIDDSKQTVIIDFGSSATWVDSKRAEKAGQVIPIEHGWAPNLQLVANKEIRRSRPEVLHVFAGGRVQCLQRFIREMWHTSNLENFPSAVSKSRFA